MTLRLLGHIELPPHRSSGGFDHGDVHSPTDRIYVAHTANDSIDVIDCAKDRYIESIPGLIAVAGALVSEVRGLIFTANRGENTVSIFAPGEERNAFKIGVGIRPNGVAFDAKRGVLVAAMSAILPLRIRIPRRSSISNARSELSKSKYPVAPGGRSTIRRPKCFLSISHRRPGLWRSMRVTQAKYRRNTRCRPKDPMVWISIRRLGVSSARAMPAY